MPTPEELALASAEFMAAAESLVLPLPTLIPRAELQSDPQAQWLIDAVEAWHMASQRPRVERGWFHASSLGKSDEELLREYRGEAGPPHDARTLRVFDLGSGRDAAWKRYLRRAGLSVVSRRAERRVRIDHLRLTGECDDIAEHPETGERVVVEFKTINPFQFSNLSGPLPAHEQQVHAYMAGLALHNAIILYESKGTQALLAFHVPFSLDTWVGITTRLRRLIREAGPMK